MKRETTAAALIFVALSVAMTWPLALNLGRAVSDPGDPFINIWILDWDWWATLHHPLALFHANVLHPAKYALAFSEHLYGIAILLFPLRLAGASPVTAYNIAMLAGFAFCGFSAFLLGRRLTGSFAAGLAAGVFYAFLPFRFIHLSHIQHVWGGWIPLLLVALLAYAEAPTWRRAGAFAAVFAMNGLTNMHYFLFGSFAIGVTALLLVPRDAWRRIAVGTAGALLVLSPFLYPYHAVAKLYATERAIGEVATYSAMPSDWLRDPAEPERRLFPGWLPLALAGAGLLSVRRRSSQVALALLWTAIGFAGSLGVNFEFHRFLHGGVPGFSGMRVPARWAVISYVGIAILIAIATLEVSRLSRKGGLLVAALLAAALWQAPIRWWIVDPHAPPVYRWLASQQVRAIAELPIDSLSSESVYLLRSTAHHKPMINGTSGSVTAIHSQLSADANATPIPDDFIDALRAVDVDLLVIHASTLGGRSGEVRNWARREHDRGRLAFVRRFDAGIFSDWVFSLGAGSPVGSPPPSPAHAELEAFFLGQVVCGSSPFGNLDTERPVIPGRTTFRGWAMSPHGIARVDLWFEGKRVRKTASLAIEPSTGVLCVESAPGRQPARRVRFTLPFDRRPAAIRRHTDLLVEITDGAGRKVFLEDRWFTWLD